MTSFASSRRRRRRRTSTATAMLIVGTALALLLFSPSYAIANELAPDAAAFDTRVLASSNDNKDHNHDHGGSGKTTFRIFQTLPYEPKTLSPPDLAKMHRTIRVTQAMVFSPSNAHHATDGSGSNNDNDVKSLQDDGVELALDIYTPKERREYLVRRGNNCHPRGNSGGGSSSGSSGTNGGLNALNAQEEDTSSLQWYDVLSRYDSLMNASANDDDASSNDDAKKDAKSNNPSTAASSAKNSAELERMAIELFKFCVLYNGDGHAFWGWEEQLLVPFKDVVKVDSNYGVVAMAGGDAWKQAAKQSSLDEVTDNVAAAAAGSASSTATNVSGGQYIHESFLSISPHAPAKSELSSMIRLLLETSDDTLAFTPLLLPRELHRLIAANEVESNKGKSTESGGANGSDKEGNGSSWTLLRNSCIPLADTVGSGSSNSGNYATTGLDAQFASIFADGSSSSTFSGMGTSSADAYARRMAARCPLSEGGYCCLTFLPEKGSGQDGTANKGNDNGMQRLPVMALRHPVGGWTSDKAGGVTKDNGDALDQQQTPYKLTYAPQKDTSKSNKHSQTLGGVPSTDLPYISTVRIIQNNTHNAPKTSTTKFPTHPADTPNFFDILFENDCLPYRKECHRCLKDVANEAPPHLPEDEDEENASASAAPVATTNACSKCALECPCYCDILCKIRPPPKQVVRTYSVRPPSYRKEPNRLVPKIIHQTWFEPISKEKYPNMSRLVESWKKSGWEYYFYDDDTAGEFLGMHFPAEVREAYESIIPGAFKADLFRYCVLLIRGGVYADMDVLLETNLDDAIANDIGFMTPIDEPGIDVGHRSCLWNGLIASAPAHPFLARTIEIVVNNIRNRFTAVDYDDMLCPNPILSVSHTVDTLFTCGPCILGAGINNLLGRHMQTEFDIGDVNIWQSERGSQLKSHDSSIRPDDPRLLIPGRTVILSQNKNDMGAHRFTWEDRHLIIAATDMPDYDDRPPSKEHYSKTHEKAGIYGMRKLYTDTKRANEEIRITVEKF